MTPMIMNKHQLNMNINNMEEGTFVISCLLNLQDQLYNVDKLKRVYFQNHRPNCKVAGKSLFNSIGLQKDKHCATLHISIYRTFKLSHMVKFH